MKALLLLLMFITVSANAQVWVEDNAVWHYDYSAIGTGGYKIVSHTSDTVLNGKNARTYSIQNMEFYWDPWNGYSLAGVWDFGQEYLHVSGDTVFRWNNGEYRVLFNFGAQVGEQWVFDVDPANSALLCDDTSRVEVSSIGIENVQGQNYSYIELNTISGSGKTLNGRFNNRFGGVYMFPQYDNCDSTIAVDFEWVGDLRCFQDDSLQLNLVGEDCEYILTHLGISDLPVSEIKLYPNPSDGNIHIDGGAVISVSVFSAEGKQVEELIFENPVNKFSFEGLKPGIYLLNLVHTEGERSNHRVIIK